MKTQDARDKVSVGPAHFGSSDGIWVGRVSSTSLRSRWASLRRSATCRWSFLRSTESTTASLRTAVMKASSGSSVDELEESEEMKRKITRRERRAPRQSGSWGDSPLLPTFSFLCVSANSFSTSASLATWVQIPFTKVVFRHRKLTFRQVKDLIKAFLAGFYQRFKRLRMLLDLSGLLHPLLPLLFHGARSIQEGVVVTVVIVLIFPIFLLALTGDWKHGRRDKSLLPPSGLCHLFAGWLQERTFIPASWRSSPRASSIRHASRQHWMAASFFLPVWVTSATSCRPKASSTGSLTGAAMWNGWLRAHSAGNRSHLLTGVTYFILQSQLPRPLSSYSNSSSSPDRLRWENIKWHKW